jgi:hypothetical protein
MITRHGPPLIILGASLAILCSTLTYIISTSLLATFAVAILCLGICAYLGNHTRAVEGARTHAPVSKPSSLTHSTLLYVTVGALIVVWSGVWYFYLLHHAPTHASQWYGCYGLLLTGFVLVVIGLLVGPIGRSAREAELPPEEVTPTAVRAEQELASRPPITPAGSLR